LLLPDSRPYPLDHLTLRGADSAIALTSREGDVTYSTLDKLVGQLASWLTSQGLNAGDSVASWLPKTQTACVIPLAAARAGMIHVPINPVLRHAQAAHILADSGAALIITQPARAASFEDDDVPPECRIAFEGDVSSAIATLSPLAPSNRDPSELCAILYTSGSTGKPKGVMLSHANLWLGAISVAHYLELTPEDRTLAVLPLAFDYGQNQLFSTWVAGGCVIPLDYLTARDVIKAIDRHDATTLAGVPPLWHQLVEADWPVSVGEKLRRATNSGGALTPSLIERMRGVFPAADIVPMYGLTEAFRSTYLPPALVTDHPTSMGRAIPFAEILIVRADGSVAADNEAGELVHCGPLVAQGYWHDAERTAVRYKPAPSASLYGGMAVWSGDTVRRDAEGLHYFVGRDDEMIKVSGNRISPTEIENAAIASGVVAEAVAIGVPDTRLGQAVVLVARADAEDDAAIMAYFKRELPAFMHPTRVIWKADLPRNANGKLDRSAIRAEVLS
jgi:acyl-CoA ligase (AMP-forming) (exosortase A-associated)